MKRSRVNTHNMDEHGKKLFHLCKSNSLLLLNGRIHGARKSNRIQFPNHPFEHPSTIDYMAADRLLLTRVKSFHVLPNEGLSYHNCSCCSILFDITVHPYQVRNTAAVDTEQIYSLLPLKNV